MATGGLTQIFCRTLSRGENQNSPEMVDGH